MRRTPKFFIVVVLYQHALTAQWRETLLTGFCQLLLLEHGSLDLTSKQDGEQAYAMVVLRSMDSLTETLTGYSGK